MTAALRPPIFIVGAPRSGTGILQNLFRLHPEVCYITQPLKVLVREARRRGIPLRTVYPVASALEAVSLHWPMDWRPSPLDRPYDGFIEDGSPVAVEGFALWTPPPSAFDHDRLTDDDSSAELQDFHRDFVKTYTDYSGATTLLSKRARHSLQIPFLRTSFPEAFFIHIVRHGEAVASSILKRRRRRDPDDIHGWWGPRPKGWQGMSDAQPIRQAGWQWRTMLDTITEDLRHVTDDRQIEVRYEELCDEPRSLLERCWSRAGLEPEGGIRVASPWLNELRNGNRKSRDKLNENQRKLLRAEIGQTLEAWDYV